MELRKKREKKNRYVFFVSITANRTVVHNCETDKKRGEREREKERDDRKRGLVVEAVAEKKAKRET